MHGIDGLYVADASLMPAVTSGTTNMLGPKKAEAELTARQRWMRGRWGEGTNADTETLRETLRMYRGFLDQLTGSRAS